MSLKTNGSGSRGRAARQCAPAALTCGGPKLATGFNLSGFQSKHYSIECYPFLKKIKEKKGGKLTCAQSYNLSVGKIIFV